jgi:uncharacterized membrane protein (DUF4010 family)
MLAYPWFKFAIAIALGLLIGLERERSKGEGPGRRPAGIRTFALATFLGALATYLGGTLLLVTATAAVAVFAALSYRRTLMQDPGLTTAIGLVLAPLLGGLAMSDSILAAAGAAAAAALFAAKAPLHRFVKSVLTEAEITDGLIFAVATLVIWPQLPNRYLGPFNSLNPYYLWLLVILMLGISACGYIATRLFGARYGLPLAGLVSGFVSSTATIGAMAARAARTPSAMGTAVAGAALSTVATFAQMGLLLLAISRPVLEILWPALLAGGLAAIAYALYFTVRALNADDAPIPEAGRPFRVSTALALAATMGVMMFAVAVLKAKFGETGMVLGAALAGFVDTHAAAMSVASLVTAGKVPAHQALLPILIAMTTNTFTKVCAAISAGYGDFVLRLVPGLLLSIAAAWATALLAPH